MELSEPNLSSNEITDSDVNEVEIENVLELELYDESHNLLKSNSSVQDVVKALSSPTRRISAQIKKLQEAGLIFCNYCSGNHGVRKISNIKFSQIIINF